MKRSVAMVTTKTTYCIPGVMNNLSNIDMSTKKQTVSRNVRVTNASQRLSFHSAI